MRHLVTRLAIPAAGLMHASARREAAQVLAQAAVVARREMRVSAADQTKPAAASAKACTLVYDGDCPMCKFSAKLVDAEEKVNARDANHPLVRKLKKAGVDLDEGSVFIDQNGGVHQGREAVQQIAKQQSGLTSVAATFGARFYDTLKWLRGDMVSETIAEQDERLSHEQQASLASHSK